MPAMLRPEVPAAFSSKRTRFSSIRAIVRRRPLALAWNLTVVPIAEDFDLCRPLCGCAAGVVSDVPVGRTIGRLSPGGGPGRPSGHRYAAISVAGNAVELTESR